VFKNEGEKNTQKGTIDKGNEAKIVKPKQGWEGQKGTYQIDQGFCETRKSDRREKGTKTELV